MSASALLWYAAWGLTDVFLCMALAGFAVAGDDPFSRVWICIGTVAVILAVNAYALSLIGF